MGYVDESRKKVNAAALHKEILEISNLHNQIIKKKEKILPAYRETIFKKCAYWEKWLKCAGKTGKKVPGDCCLN